MKTLGINQTGTILDRIVTRKVEEVEDLPFSRNDYADYTPRDFLSALRRDTVALIAEIKHASPSQGVLIDPFDPILLGTIYAQSGASAISVLTDKDFFQGSLDDLRTVRNVVDVPILRKDFIIDVRQMIEARAAGADAVLLIVAILDDGLLRELYNASSQYSLTTLIEVHTEAEMERALRLDPPLIGINNRDLHTFKVDMDVTKRLAKMAPKDVMLVAENGIYTTEHVKQLADSGARAILVGESIVKSGNIGEQVRTLSGIRVP